MALLGRPEAQGLAHDAKEAISMVTFTGFITGPREKAFLLLGLFG
jgi:hypothetical protein